MDDLISRKALLKSIKNSTAVREVKFLAEVLVRTEPTIEAEPVRWLPASEPPDHYRDEYGELIPLLVCEDGTDYPYRAFYDGRNWGDGYVVVPVKWWMPLPQPPKMDGGAENA